MRVALSYGSLIAPQLVWIAVFNATALTVALAVRGRRADVAGRN